MRLDGTLRHALPVGKQHERHLVILLEKLKPFSSMLQD
jgi:hypothetical protein